MQTLLHEIRTVSEAVAANRQRALGVLRIRGTPLTGGWVPGRSGCYPSGVHVARRRAFATTLFLGGAIGQPRKPGGFNDQTMRAVRLPTATKRERPPLDPQMTAAPACRPGVAAIATRRLPTRSRFRPRRCRPCRVGRDDRKGHRRKFSIAELTPNPWLRRTRSVNAIRHEWSPPVGMLGSLLLGWEQARPERLPARSRPARSRLAACAAATARPATTRTRSVEAYGASVVVGVLPGDAISRSTVSKSAG